MDMLNGADTVRKTKKALPLFTNDTYKLMHSWITHISHIGIPAYSSKSVVLTHEKNAYFEHDNQE